MNTRMISNITIKNKVKENTSYQLNRKQKILKNKTKEKKELYNIN
jgi:hypothetical protein